MRQKDVRELYLDISRPSARLPFPLRNSTQRF